MSRLTAELVVSLLDRVTAPARAAVRSVDGLRAAAVRNARQMNQMRGRMLDAAAVGYALARAVSAPTRAAMEFESAMADVRKVVDFPTPQAFKDMKTDILQMSKVIAMSATSLSAITAAAGQAGMQGDELLVFTEMAAKVGVAFDIAAGTAGESLAKIKTALGTTVEETGLLADAMNHLSNNSASAAPDLLNFMQRVAAFGKQYGFTAEQTTAIGSAMIAAGARTEVAATSFNNVGRALSRGASASKRQKAALDSLGLSATDVARRLQDDAVGTLMDVVERIRALPRHVQASTISDLFGDEARALAPLIENSKLLSEALGLVGDQANYAGSATEEYAVRAETAENKLQLARNKAQALAIAIGDALLPAIVSITEAVGPVIDAMASWAAANPAVIAGVVGVAASLIGLRVVTIAARYAFLFFKGGLLDIGIAAGRSAGLIVAATKRMRLAVLGFSMLAGLGGGAGIAGLAAGIASAASAIVPAAAAIGAAIAGITAPVWALVAAVAAVAFAVYRYWEPISNFSIGFASGVRGALEPLVGYLGEVGSRIASAVASWFINSTVSIARLLGFDPDAVRASLEAALAAVRGFGSQVVGYVQSLPGMIGDWISEIFTMKDFSSQAEASFRDAGRRAGLALVNAVKRAIADLIEWFKGLPDRIMKAIGRIDIGSLISMPRIFGGGGSPAVDAARAAGGPVVGGRTYLVGEQGAELFTPDRSGRIVPNHEMQAQSGSTAAAPAQSISFGDIHIHGAQDVDAIVDELKERLADALGGIQADREWAVS